MYFMILMFFDSVNMIFENFFSKEILFVIVLTFVFSELIRLCVIFLNKISFFNRSLKIRIVFQMIFTSVLSVIIVSVILHLYFIFVEGFSYIKTELIVFNSLYLLAVIFYNLFYFSLEFINLKNEQKIIEERRMKENLDLEIQAFKTKINPKLLFQSLETIISELHSDKKSADNLVSELSKIYRYTLDNRFNDLVLVKDELKSLKSFINILNVKYQGNVKFNIKIATQCEESGIVPATLLAILEQAVNENIITGSLPLNISIKSLNNSIIVKYKINKHIICENDFNNRIKFIEKAYNYFSDKAFNIFEEQGFKNYEIKLLNIEEEN